MMLFELGLVPRANWVVNLCEAKGHLHRSSRRGWSPPEVYKAWMGRVLILYAGAHRRQSRPLLRYPRLRWRYCHHSSRLGRGTISGDVDNPVAFGTPCDREYGFLYEGVRKRRG